MNLTYIGPSIAVCERCLVRCDGWYRDDGTGRARITLCPSCGNGDPQLITDDHADPNIDLDDDTRFALYMLHGE